MRLSNSTNNNITYFDFQVYLHLLYLPFFMIESYSQSPCHSMMKPPPHSKQSGILISILLLDLPIQLVSQSFPHITLRLVMEVVQKVC